MAVALIRKRNTSALEEYYSKLFRARWKDTDNLEREAESESSAGEDISAAAKYFVALTNPSDTGDFARVRQICEKLTNLSMRLPAREKLALAYRLNLLSSWNRRRPAKSTQELCDYLLQQAIVIKRQLPPQFKTATFPEQYAFARQEFSRKNLAQAEQMAREMLPLAEASNGYPLNPDSLYELLADIYHARKKDKEANAFFFKIIERAEKTHGPHSAKLAEPVYRYAEFLLRTNQFSEAKPVISQYMGLLPGTNASAALARLASEYRHSGDTEFTLKLYKSALDYEQRFASGYTVAELFAQYLKSIERDKESLEILKSALERAQQSQSNGLPIRGVVDSSRLQNLTRQYFDLAEKIGDTSQFTQSLRERQRKEMFQAQRDRKASLERSMIEGGQKPQERVLIMCQLATHCFADNEYSDGERLTFEALALLESLNHAPHTASSLSNLAAYLQEKGDLTRWRQLFERLLKWSCKYDHSSVEDVVLRLRYSTRKGIDSNQLGDEIIQKTLNNLDPDAPARLVLLRNLAELKAHRCDFAASTKFYAELQEAYEKANDTPNLLHTYAAMASVALSAKQLVDVRKYANLALVLAKTTAGNNLNRGVGMAVSRLANTCRAVSEFDLADDLMLQAMRIEIERWQGMPEYRRMFEYRTNRADILQAANDYERKKNFSRQVQFLERVSALEAKLQPPVDNSWMLRLRLLKAYVLNNQYPKANKLFLEMVSAIAQMIGPKRTSSIQDLRQYQALLRETGHAKEAHEIEDKIYKLEQQDKK